MGLDFGFVDVYNINTKIYVSKISFESGDSVSFVKFVFNTSFGFA